MFQGEERSSLGLASSPGQQADIRKRHFCPWNREPSPGSRPS